MRKQIPFLLATICSLSATAQERSSENDERFARVLERFPQADANGDGILSRDEAHVFIERRKAALAEREVRNAAPTPTHADVSYGEHRLQAFDIWLADSPEKPTPLVVFIHGGGFRGGNKSGIKGPEIERFLASGISVASMNYRLTEEGKYPYPIPMEDSARGLQTILSRAEEWNLDPDKVAAYGGSAGAGISLWLAFREDLADPVSEDPIARQSTRLLAAGTMNGQSTYDLRTFREWFGVPELEAHTALPDFYAMTGEDNADTPRVAALAEDASAINHLTPDDPPVFMYYSRPNETVTAETEQAVWVHHPLLGLKLQEKMKELGIESIVVAPDIKDTTYEDLPAFLISKLKE